MLAIKRWIIIAVAGVVVLAAALAILLSTCLGKDDDTVSSGASSQYTESELQEIRDWWNSGAEVVEE